MVILSSAIIYMLNNVQNTPISYGYYGRFPVKHT